MVLTPPMALTELLLVTANVDERLPLVLLGASCADWV